MGKNIGFFNMGSKSLISTPVQNVKHGKLSWESAVCRAGGRGFKSRLDQHYKGL